MAFMAYYYSVQQAGLLRRGAEKSLDEISTALALSIELSLDNQSFEGLEKAINLATKTNDFEFVAIIQRDGGGRESIFASNPVNLDPRIPFQNDYSRFIYRKRMVNSRLLSGYVIIASSREKVEAAISELNRPLFMILSGVLLVSLVVFMAFARHLSAPVAYLTSVAENLTQGNYDIQIEERSKATEIADLNKALQQLRNALWDARKKNADFSRQLENEIQARTLDLENTRMRLLEAQEAAELGNYEIDLESGTWIASDTIFSIFSIPEGFSLSNNSWKTLLSRQNEVLISRLFSEALQKNTSFQHDVCIRNAENLDPERWITITGRPVSQDGPDGRIIRGTIQDISNRKKTENEVRRLSLVAEKTSNCVIITDTDRRILWVNESTLRITGFTREEILGRSPGMFQFEKTSAATKKLISENLKALKEVNTEILNRSKTGREYWLHINIVPLFDNDGRHIGFMAVESDITERVKFEQELQSSEENYRSILENSSEMIHTIDNDGRLIWANRSWKEKLGLAGKEIEGLFLTQFLDEKTMEEFKRVIPALMNGENVTDLDCVFLSLEGSALNLQGRAIPLFRDNEIVGSQAYLHDITSIRKAEHDLKQLLELTRRQNERLRNFTHIVSHNLRSHSSNLSGLINLLSLELPDFRENVFFINFQSAVNSLMDVIRNLSEVALIHTEGDKDFQPIDLRLAVEKANSSVFALAKNAGVEIRNSVRESSIVIADPGYIDSILLNLLTNAIKYRSDERPPVVEIRVETGSGAFLRLDVIDNGLGIDLERQGRKIFGMYKTFHKHPDARGVGLFLTKNQVEAMGGRIEVQSKLNEGTIFSVYLKPQTEQIN